MDFRTWFALFGELVQKEARAQGCADYDMDDYIENAYLRHTRREHGELDITDKVKYGNLDLSEYH